MTSAAENFVVFPSLQDPAHLIKLFATFFSHFSSVDKQLVMD